MISACLKIDPTQRMTADELLAQDYFEIEFVERFAQVMQSLKSAEPDELNQDIIDDLDQNILNEVNEFQLEQDQFGQSSFKLFAQHESTAKKQDFSYDTNEIREEEASERSGDDDDYSSGVGGQGGLENYPLGVMTEESIIEEERNAHITPMRTRNQASNFVCVTEESTSGEKFKNQILNQSLFPRADNIFRNNS